MDIYENCPVLENDNLLIRLIESGDADDLLAVYGDKYALPFFNSDNCNGSNFYCASRIDVENTIKFWLIEYHENKSFVRLSIVGKKAGKAVGTIEMFRREAKDYYHDCALMRIDLRSDCEKTHLLYSVLSLVTEPFFDWFACSMIATKAPVYAVERIEALKKAGFRKSEEPLMGTQDGRAYYDYWVRECRKR
ncbi:MAG: N-acetyltransferase [Ruminococcus sp.]|nr:N-acetyltransferase [Ruminococcus sp.]